MTQATAVRIHRFGGPDVLQVDELELPAPGPGEALVRVDFAGVNFIDIFQRQGVAREPQFPMGIGVEGAGVVEQLGPHVRDIQVGERVAWVRGAPSYASHALVPTEWLVPVPDALDTQEAAACLLQGLTAHCLTTASYPLGKADVCLVRAAAGGVSLLLTQLAKRVGAEVIGTVSTAPKVAAARRAGADHVLVEGDVDVAAEVQRLTGGAGAHVVYDGVGLATFDSSLAALRRDGVLVLYGQASGPVPPLDLRRLQPMALYVTRGGLSAHAADRDSILARAGELFAWVAGGAVIPRIDDVLPLSAAAEAHERLAGRRNIGKLLLAPA